MAERYLETVLTPAVRAAQEHYYKRSYPRFDAAGSTDQLGVSEAAFLGERDSFYLATVTENGWPYVQHRGGPVGFLRVLGPSTLGFADYGGNRQLVSAGSLTRNDRVALFAVDYPNRTRLKILGHATVLDAREHPDLVAAFAPDAGHSAKVERLFRIEVLSYDWNCPKFITQRFTRADVESVVEPLRNRIVELEALLAKRTDPS